MVNAEPKYVLVRLAHVARRLTLNHRWYGGVIRVESMRKLLRGPEKVALLYLNVEVEGNAKRCLSPCLVLPGGLVRSLLVC